MMFFLIFETTRRYFNEKEKEMAMLLVGLFIGAIIGFIIATILAAGEISTY
jgi:hypothetical protein